MKLAFHRYTVLTCALLSMAVFAPATQADTALATGGYSREFQKIEMMNMLDKDGDHKVTNDEFTGYFTQVFEELDTNRDGTLDTKEWVGTKGKQDISVATGGYSRELRTLKMMGMMDSDGDHKVTKDEFLTYQGRVYNTMAAGSTTIDAQNWLRSITKN
jgi:Ca2+-binding EF-hand superfamily protein